MTRRKFFTLTGILSLTSVFVPKALAKTTESKFMVLDKPNSYWKEHLSDMQYYVMRKEGTERAFTSPLNNEKREGTYVCAACLLPLFKSEYKYDSKTGWPSFFDVIDGHVNTKRDFKLIYPRTEYHCAKCGGHQGHVFNDGPKPTGLRYCNNGVALKFIPKEES
jgi:peptide-methionine (R)-S-oxide reductase